MSINNKYTIPETYEVQLEIDYVQIKSHKHRIAYAGNPKGIPVIVMMGVFEDSLKDSRWLVASMVNNPDAKDLRFVVITVPFLEEYTEIKLDPNTKAKYDGMIPPARIIKMKNKLPVDPRFDLENCAYTLKSILEVLLSLSNSLNISLVESSAGV